MADQRRHLAIVCLQASICSLTPCESISATAVANTPPTLRPPASSNAMYRCSALTWRDSDKARASQRFHVPEEHYHHVEQECTAPYLEALLSSIVASALFTLPASSTAQQSLLEHASVGQPSRLHALECSSTVSSVRA